jgi:hypothetical protein
LAERARPGRTVRYPEFRAVGKVDAEQVLGFVDLAVGLRRRRG